MKLLGDIYSTIFSIQFLKFNKIVIFGAGGGAGVAYVFLRKHMIGKQVVFAENDTEKVGRLYYGCQVLNIYDCVNWDAKTLYILPFRATRVEAEPKARMQLEDTGVKSEQIISYRSLWFWSDQYDWEKRIIHSIYTKRRLQVKKRAIVSCIRTVVTLTYGEEAPKGGCGGYRAGASCQKSIMGDKFNNINLLYGFGEENRFSILFGDPFKWIIERIEYVRLMVESLELSNTVFIAHDFITGFALAKMGTLYRMVFHNQGSVLDERRYFGIEDTEGVKKYIRYMEKEAFANAYQVHFPSDGAARALIDSRDTEVRLGSFNRGCNLPVTVWGDEKEKEVATLISKEGDCIILSIGQMSWAKGIDRIPDLLNELLEHGFNDGRIIWVVVGDGPMRNEIISRCDLMSQKYEGFHYYWFPKLNYGEVRFLHNKSHIYCMLQRVSIFDISTLEAMKAGKVVILSREGGNTEYDKRNNIIFADDFRELLADLKVNSFDLLGKKNRNVFDEFFSEKIYKDRFSRLLSDWETELNGGDSYVV